MRTKLGWLLALLVAVGSLAGPAKAAPMELSAWVDVGGTVPPGLAQNLKEFHTLYVPAYLVVTGTARPNTPLFSRLYSRLPQVWAKFFGDDCKAAGVKVLGVVFNPRMPGGKYYRLDELSSLLRDPVRGARAQGELLDLARQDGLDGIMTCFRGANEALKAPFVEWFGGLCRMAASRGAEVDVSLSVQSDQEPNVDYSSLQSFKGLGEKARRSIFSAGGYTVTWGGGLAAPNGDLVNGYFSYAKEQLPNDRCMLQLTVGGKIWQNGKMIDIGWDDWQSTVARLGKPERLPDGHLRLELANGEATFNDATTMARSVKLVAKAGLKGLCLDNVQLIDPGFWRYWSMNNR